MKFKEHELTIKNYLTHEKNKLPGGSQQRTKSVLQRAAAMITATVANTGIGHSVLGTLLRNLYILNHSILKTIH